MRIVDGIPIWGDQVDEGAFEQIKRCKNTADYVALMADHHKGYAVPIGGVVAYRDKISPSGVGFDIACGNKAVLTDADPVEVRRNISTIMDDIWSHISFGIGRNNNEKVEHELFEDDPAWGIPEVSRLKQMASNQLGTVGSGNHYVDIFTDESDRVWIGVHFGSRGLGHKIATFFLKSAGAKDGMDVDPCVLEANSQIGQDYLVAMSLAGRYAYAGRDWVCSQVASLLGAKIIEEVHNHHNFAWREEHFGNKLWVVRKGATPAWPNQKGFIGGSMGEAAYIVRGNGATATLDPDERALSLYSTVHGAGRVMSRTMAAGKSRTYRVWHCGMRECGLEIPVKEVSLPNDGSNPRCPNCGGKMHKWLAKEVKSLGIVTKDMMHDWVKKAGVELRGAGVDESPHCYKRLDDVIACHSSSISILHKLTPIGVAMASPDIEDPYKD